MNSVRGLAVVDDTQTAVTILVRRLGDHHSGFIAPEAASRLQSQESGEPDAGAWTSPESQLLEEKFGYVTIPGFADINDERETRFADQIQQALADIDGADTCGWIVDLRSNSGGNMWPMLAGIGPILGNGELGSLRNNDGTRAHWWYRVGASGLGDEINAETSEAYELTQPNAPVAVLIGPLTASSGEAVALSFVGRRHTRSFGTNTAGRTTGNEPFTLTDGAILNLATSVMTDRDYREYADGIEPDVVVEEQPESQSLADQRTVQAATRWLSRFESCR